MPSSATSADAKASHTAPSGPRPVLLRLSTLIGIGLAIGGGAFVIAKIVTGWTRYGDVIAQARWSWLLAALILAVVGMSAMGLVWRSVIRALGGVATRRQVFVWYQLGNLGKYLPGGLWPLLGRSELAVRGGLGRPIAYNSVALSMGAAYLCATLLCTLFLPFVLVRQGGFGVRPWFLVLVPVGLAILHPTVLGRLLRVTERLLGKGAPPIVPPWRSSVGLVLRYALPWSMIGGATWFVALTFDPSAPVLTVLFATVLSWIIGFLVVPVPGGIGVREAAFTAVTSLVMPAQIAATIAVVSRLVFVVADGLAAMAAAFVSRRRHPR